MCHWFGCTLSILHRLCSEVLLISTCYFHMPVLKISGVVDLQRIDLSTRCDIESSLSHES